MIPGDELRVSEYTRRLDDPDRTTRVYRVGDGGVDRIDIDGNLALVTGTSGTQLLFCGGWVMHKAPVVAPVESHEPVAVRSDASGPLYGPVKARRR